MQQKVSEFYIMLMPWLNYLLIHFESMGGSTLLLVFR